MVNRKRTTSVCKLKPVTDCGQYRDGSAFALRVERSDIARWTHERVPVVLILYEAQTDSACWLDIKDYFRRLDGFHIFTGGKTITVYLPRANKLDEDAVRHLAAMKNQALETERTQL